MTKLLYFFVALIAVSNFSPLLAQSSLKERLRETITERRKNGEPSITVPGSSGAVEMSYGRDALQKLDFWKSNKPGAPLVIYVHGGGWKRGDKRGATGQKDEHFVEQGYAFASINYRLVPAHTVEEQAGDVADAVAFLIARSESLGFDGRRVVLTGHSAGAHLVALVGTDLRYLKKAGLSRTSLRGVIPIDGAAYDVPQQIAESGRMMNDTYLQAFGRDHDRQIALSPTSQAMAPNAPAFLILHVQRSDAVTQSKGLADALRKAGTKVEIRDFEGFGLKGHGEINHRLGDPSYPATPVVDEWLKRVFAAPDSSAKPAPAPE
jgi:acetyl esterase/lipase